MVARYGFGTVNTWMFILISLNLFLADDVDHRSYIFGYFDHHHW